jgi:hypothetical protein
MTYPVCSGNCGEKTTDAKSAMKLAVFPGRENESKNNLYRLVIINLRSTVARLVSSKIMLQSRNRRIMQIK